MGNAEQVNDIIQANPLTMEGKRTQFIEKKTGDLEGNEVITGTFIESTPETGKVYVTKMFEINETKY